MDVRYILFPVLAVVILAVLFVALLVRCLMVFALLLAQVVVWLAHMAWYGTRHERIN